MRTMRAIIHHAAKPVTAVVVLLTLGVPPASASVTDLPDRTSSVLETHPIAGAGYYAWLQNSRAHPDHLNGYVKPDGQSKFRVNGRGTEAGFGAIDGTTLVYQQFASYSDIKFLNLTTHARRDPPKGVNTKNWEYGPAMERPWLVFVRQNVRTGKRTLVLFNLNTHTSKVLDEVGSNGYLQPGQVNGGVAVWVHLTPRGRSRIYIYDIAGRTLTKVPNTKGYDWAPSVTEGGSVYFERTGRSCGTNPRMMRYAPGSAPVALFSLPSGIDMSTSYVFPLADGSIQVLHDRVKCSKLKFGWDTYRFVDDFTVTLTVTVAGSGTVTSSPAGIGCSSVCSHGFEPGTDVTLTAIPGGGSAFTGWSDASCPGTDPCSLSLTTDTSITATFNP
jgi:hypothetical protein